MAGVAGPVPVGPHAPRVRPATGTRRTLTSIEAYPVTCDVYHEYVFDDTAWSDHRMVISMQG